MTATTRKPYVPTDEELALKADAEVAVQSEGIDRMSPAEIVAPWATSITRGDATVEVIGAWTWATFAGKPDDWTRALLKAAGFRWNTKRKCWQHSGGVMRPAHKRADKSYLAAKYGAAVVYRGKSDD